MFFLFLIIFNFLFNFSIFSETFIKTSSDFFTLDSEIESFARRINSELLKSKYLDKTFLKNVYEVRRYNLEDGGEVFYITTGDGFRLKGTYFNRNSDILVVVGTGFCDPRERKSIFIDMLPYDLVFFDKRAEGWDHHIDFSVCDIDSWRSALAIKLLKVNPKLETFGVTEHEDIIKVVEHFKEKKDYKEVIGWGLCYSAVLFPKVAFERPDLFTKLILDGCWLSIDNLIGKYLKHGIKMLPSLQLSRFINWAVFDRELVKYFAVYVLAKRVLGLKFDESHLSILDYLSYLNLPILFIHGLKDLFSTREEFNEIFEAVKNGNKIAWITQNAHARNHLFEPGLYKLICELFINCSIQDTSFYLHNPQNLEKFLST